MTIISFEEIKIDPELENAIRGYTDREWQDLEDSMKKRARRKTLQRN